MFIAVKVGVQPQDRVLATDFSTGSELSSLRNSSNSGHKDPVALFNTLNGLSPEVGGGGSSVPRHLAKSQQSATKHADHAEQIKTALKKELLRTTRALCSKLGLDRADFTNPIYRLSYTFLCRVLADRLQGKRQRVEKMKQELKFEQFRCTVCGKMPPFGPDGGCWTRRSQTNRHGRLCDDCDDEEIQYPRPDTCSRQLQIDKYENRLPALSLAKVSVVAACLFIEAERKYHRFRIIEICAAMEELGCGKQKETVKKWVARVRVVAKIPAVPLVDRITGFAGRLLDQHHRSPDPRIDEQERADLYIMARGILHAEAVRAEQGKKGSLRGQEKKKPTVQHVDGMLNTCLLDARLSSPPLKQLKQKVLGGHSERLVAAVLVYLRLRLRGDQDNSLTILQHRALAGVDMQSFQSCKSYVIRLIDPALWAV